MQNSELNTKVFNTVSIEPYPVADPIYFHGKHVTYRGVLCSTVEKIGNEYGAQGATVQHYCTVVVVNTELCSTTVLYNCSGNEYRTLCAVLCRVGICRGVVQCWEKVRILLGDL